MNSLPGWTIKIDEVSNGVFKVTLTDLYGRKAEIIDNATDETIEKAISYAFEIERQVSKNWNKFLYDLSLLNINHQQIINKQYSDQAFGSWFIELDDRKIILDGKEFELSLAKRNGQIWNTEVLINKNNLTYFKWSYLVNL